MLFFKHVLAQTFPWYWRFVEDFVWKELANKHLTLH